MEFNTIPGRRASFRRASGASRAARPSTSPPGPRVSTSGASMVAFGSLGRLGFAPAPNTTGVRVDERSAFTLPAFFSGVNCIASDLSALPLELVQVTDGVRRPAVEHRAWPAFARSPDGVTTSMRFRSALTAHAIVYGGGFAEIVPSVDRSRLYLYLLDPELTRADFRPDGAIQYLCAGGPIDKDRVLHFAGLSHDGLTGHPLVMHARQTLGLGMAAERFGGTYLGQGSASSGWLKTPADLKADARDQFLAYYDARHAGPENAGRTGILPPGWDMVESKGGANPATAQLMDLRRFSVLEVARLLRVPPHKLGDYSNASYSSIEAANLEYVQTTLIPWAVALEQSLNLRLLTDAEIAAGYTFRHDFTALLRADAAGRSALDTTLFNTTSISPNEIRAREGMNPRPGGDDFLTPLNMAPGNPPTPPPSAGMTKPKESAK
jgi:HK97 family phage portal protein